MKPKPSPDPADYHEGPKAVRRFDGLFGRVIATPHEQIEKRATHGTESVHRIKDYEIETNHPDEFRRDTDGDGIPDLWEAEHGLNPLVNDIGQDSDGDGWADFEEIIRGSDPNDPSSVPLDTDLDGWSDYDEEVRGTDPYDPIAAPFPDRPVATRLMEVEYLVSGTIRSDAAETMMMLKPDMGELTVLDVLWNTRYDQAALPTAADFNLTEDGIPPHLRKGQAAAALAAGNLPPLRLPAGEPLIPRVVHLDPLPGERPGHLARGGPRRVVRRSRRRRPGAPRRSVVGPALRCRRGAARRHRRRGGGGW